jgi:hypothetical protein
VSVDDNNINMNTTSLNESVCMRRQTLRWLEYVPRDKIDTKNMVMVIKYGIPKFVPKHLL